MYTVLFCGNAGGDFLPSNVLFKAKHLYSSWCTNGPSGAHYDTSDSGWMETDQFLSGLKRCLSLMPKN
jgi:hypothetical protein